MTPTGPTPAGPTPTGPEFLAPATREALARLQDATAPLERLAGIRSTITALEAEPATLDAIREALAAGATWDDVASAAGLGVTAAKWRWAGTDAEIAARHEAGRKRSARPSSRPRDLPGMSVADAARHFGISVQGVYQRINRGQLHSETIELDDGRTYKRVFLE
ncbi:MAG: hypothetical protein ACTHKX_12215 [Pseudolysinimonas sp.]